MELAAFRGRMRLQDARAAWRSLRPGPSEKRQSAMGNLVSRSDTREWVEVVAGFKARQVTPSRRFILVTSLDGSRGSDL
jgi:hypothetical protein